MLVISLGGSVIVPNKVRLEYIEKFRNFMDSFEDKIAVVVGGGSTAREYISVGREFGFDENMLDEMGIRATRLNAMLLITPETYPRVPITVEEAVMALRIYKNVVMGGTEPGHTTDGVALLLAERLHVDRVINVTSVGGIYDRDPKKYDDAKIIRKMSYESAEKILLERTMGAGLNVPIDILALKIAERSRIKIYVVPEDLDNLMKAIRDENFQGTVIEESDS